MRSGVWTSALVVIAAWAVAAVGGSAPRSEAALVPGYPVHTNVTATVFWVGEPIGNGSTENNAVSAYDDKWEAHYGGYDDYTYVRTYPFFPRFVPHENPFYLDVPYDDFTDSGSPRSDRSAVPWARVLAPGIAAAARSGQPYSVMKNRWVKMWRVVRGKLRTCYGQVEDAGPYVYDDAHYVFSRTNARPASQEAENAGMDVSPAIRDCLAFSGLNNADNKLSWRFVEARQVPPGPWRRVVTTRQVYWP
ncbi:MAG TPA: hypothetical protein VGQ38_20565 [Gaiellaceae bacterium]|nr:hypothetical protein [Gaiellaceae bacterium]